MKAEITVGVSGSGKTTHGEKRCAEGNWICLDRDDMRFSLKKVPDWNLYKFDKKVERMVTEMHTAAFYSAAKEGYNVVIAETNLNPRTRAKWKGICEDAGYEVEFVEMHIELDEAIRRNAIRDNGLPEKVIRQQWIAWTKYLEEKDEH